MKRHGLLLNEHHKSARSWKTTKFVDVRNADENLNWCVPGGPLASVFQWLFFGAADPEDEHRALFFQWVTILEKTAHQQKGKPPPGPANIG